MENKNFDFNKYRDTITRLSSLISKEQFKDVTFVFEGSEKVIKAHKCILAAASPVFEAMFSGDFKEKDQVKIEDIRPEVFQLLLDGIYLKAIRFNKMNKEDVASAADLYYAAEKYDIKDLRQVTKDFMLESVTPRSTYFLLAKSRLFDMKDLKTACEEVFTAHTYNVLSRLFKLWPADDLMSMFFALPKLNIKHEFELYVALEFMVKDGNLKDYSKCLSQIRFLTMTTREVLSCDLLKDSEKVSITANIEANLYYEEPVVPMSPHLSTSTKKRSSNRFWPVFRLTFWVIIMLFTSYNYQKYFKLFVKFFNVSDNDKQSIEFITKNARDKLKVNVCDEWKITKITAHNISDVLKTGSLQNVNQFM